MSWTEADEEESYSEIEPMISPGETPSVPSSLYGMKRRADQRRPNGKRQRIYEDHHGNTVYADEDLFKMQQRVNTGLADGDHDNLEPIDDDEELSPFEDEAQVHRDNQVRIQRGIKAARVVASAEAKRRVTPGVRKIRQVLQSQNITNEDLINGLDNDDEGLLWYSVVNPETSLVNRMLKANTNQDSCYGCSRGIGIARVSHEKLEDLRNLIVDAFPTTHIIDLCIMVSEYFETEIRKRFNRTKARGLAPLESWSPSSIYEHITYHMTEASFIHNKLLRDALQHYRVVLSREVYRVPSEYARPGAPITLAQTRVTRRGHDMFMQSGRYVLEILKQKPETMSNFNAGFNISKAYTGPLIQKADTRAVSKTTSIFDDIDTGI